MNSRPVGSAPPPFYWKVPVPEKDYMSENYRRIRQIANQSQKKRNEPMKAAFIPGVTRNEKYAHVPSRVGEFLKNKKEPSEPSASFESLKRPQQQQPRTSSSSIKAQPINRRLSKSSTDLRPSTFNPGASTNGTNAPAGLLGNSAPLRQRRGSETSNRPESVYNWHFKDDVNAYPSSVNLSNSFNSSAVPPKYCHVVEYLPCDGICAEENFVVDETTPESARSASSCRTSRGCNTEETRILDDPVKGLELSRHADSLSPIEGIVVANSVGNGVNLPKSRSVFTLRSKDAASSTRGGRNENSAEWPQYGSMRSRPKENELGTRLDPMRVPASAISHLPENGRIKPSMSGTSLRNAKLMNGSGGGGDALHTPGTVPKYLKQRQEEWRIQEKEKKEAELNANVPHGYVLLSNEERLEHLDSFKRNYDTLINDLNRIPIRIDTIRVREHKIQLEQQLTRLEEAMKTFSRPRVWIKVDG